MAMQISYASSVIVETMVQVIIIDLPNGNQRWSSRSTEQTAANPQRSYNQGNDGNQLDVSKRWSNIQMKKTWAKRLWLENTVIRSLILLSSIDGPIREPLHVRWSHTLIELAFQVANLRYLAHEQNRKYCSWSSRYYTINSYRLP